MTKADEITTAWAAGIFEGEGTFSFYKGAAKSIAISMTDLDILQRLQSSFGGKIYTLNKRQEHWKDAWLWSLSGEAGVEFVSAILPYLGDRRKARGQEWLDDLKNRRIKGEKESAKVADKRKQIYAMLDSGLKQREIAEMFGVERSYVAHVKRKAL